MTTLYKTPVQRFSKKAMTILLASMLLPALAAAQEKLSLKEALKVAVDNYGMVKAKKDYASASQSGVTQAKLEYLPNFNLAAQINYGTVNGQNGPAYAFGSVSTLSSGIPLASQNWNAAFGGLYASNINWDVFAFGRARERIRTASAVAARDEKDYEQEIFQHKVRVAATYLNLLAAQRLTDSYQKNLNRANALRNLIVVKAAHDLVAGVDSTQATAEVSSARSILLKAMNFEADQNSNLTQLLGTGPTQIEADTIFVSVLPKSTSVTADSLSAVHPVLQYYNAKVLLAEEQVKYSRTFYYPTISMGAVLQTRGSGFNYSYTADQPRYNSSFSHGINPTRSNYIVALGITWNIAQPLRFRQQVKSQRMISRGLREELAQTKKQLAIQSDLSDIKLKNAVADYYETPIQVKAAGRVYAQKSVLYKQGLTTLVDVTQSLYALIRAETDRDIAYTNVWQALLLKAASQGDFSIFSDNL